MKKFNLLISTFILIISISCSPKTGKMLNKTEFSPAFLTGTWKLRDQNKFEKWSQTGPTEWMGVAYDMSTGIAEISEYMKIYKSDKNWILEAKVKENQFVPVYFKHIPDPFWTAHFVNDQHDFPQVVSYRLGENVTLYAQIKDLKGSNMIDYEFMKETTK